MIIREKKSSDMYNQTRKINKINPEINESVTFIGVLLKIIFINFFYIDDIQKPIND
jgi:hypothetical protein